jgi:hypothetical protein
MCHLNEQSLQDIQWLVKGINFDIDSFEFHESCVMGSFHQAFIEILDLVHLHICGPTSV